MSEDIKNTKKPNKKYKNLGVVPRVILYVLSVAVVSGVSVVGLKIANVLDGTKEDDGVEETETSGKNLVRNTITIEETAEGEILINGVGFDPDSILLGEGRVFMERIPMDCTETLASLRTLIGKNKTLVQLERLQRYEFELLDVLAKDVCSYEEYRNILVDGLAEFIYTPAGADDIETGPETAVPTEPVLEIDEAGDLLTTPENK